MTFPMKFSVFILLSLFVSLSALADVQIRIASIHDGDTLTAYGVADSRKYKVRLMGLDTPEIDFDRNTQGEVAYEARNYLMSLLPVGTVVQLSNDSQVDKHGRVLGRILRRGVDINKEMLRQGWGVMYFIYPFDKSIVAEYVQVAKEAYMARKGIFSERYQDTEIPYEFRLRVRNHTGFHPVGDFETKRIYSPEQADSVPVWKRVYFPNYDLARQNGYRH